MYMCVYVYMCIYGLITAGYETSILIFNLLLQNRRAFTLNNASDDNDAAAAAAAAKAQAHGEGEGEGDKRDGEQRAGAVRLRPVVASSMSHAYDVFANVRGLAWERKITDMGHMGYGKKDIHREVLVPYASCHAYRLIL
jgi:hypothetical protein